MGPLYKIVAPERFADLDSLLFRFTRPSSLNDPFELRPSFAAAQERLIKKIHDLGARNPPPTWESFYSLMERFTPLGPQVQEMLPTLAGRPSTLVSYCHELTMGVGPSFWDMFDEWGVFSMTSNPLAARPWSHYGCNHQGFAIEFSREEISEWVRMMRHQDPTSIFGVSVNYRSTRPRLTKLKFDGKNTKQMIKATFGVKSVNWKDESEERLVAQLSRCDTVVFDKEPIHLFRLPKETITGILIGANCRLSETDFAPVFKKHKIGPHIRKLRLSETNYGLA